MEPYWDGVFTAVVYLVTVLVVAWFVMGWNRFRWLWLDLRSRYIRWKHRRSMRRLNRTIADLSVVCRQATGGFRRLSRVIRRINRVM